MKAKPFIVPLLLVVVFVSLFASALLASPLLQRQKEKPQQPKGGPIYIPNEVKTVLLQGLATREARVDIPFTVSHSIYLPARDALHSIFFLKIKNADLGYIPLGQGQPVPKKEKNEAIPQEAQAQPQAHPPAGAQLQASFNMFLMFNLLDGGQPKIYREVYVPCNFQVDQASYNPEKEDYYIFGYPLPAGHYLLAIALTSLDLKKIGTQYYEFTLPDPNSFKDTIDTTPIFFIKEIERMDAPEMRTTLHKDSFTYSILKIVPNIERLFAVGENLDIFFFVFGAQTDAEQKCSLEINYEVKKDDELAIRWVPQTYDAPLISQPLPLKQTVIVKQGEEQRQETRDLPAGKYTLEIKIQDKISSKTLTKTVDFEVR